MLSSLQSLYLVQPTVAAGQVPPLCLDHEEEEDDDDHHDDDHEEEQDEDDDGNHDHDHDIGGVLKEETFILNIHFISIFINNLYQIFFRIFLFTEMKISNA